MSQNFFVRLPHKLRHKSSSAGHRQKAGPFNARAIHCCGRQTFKRPGLLSGWRKRVAEGIMGSERQYRTFWDRSRDVIATAVLGKTVFRVG